MTGKSMISFKIKWGESAKPRQSHLDKAPSPSQLDWSLSSLANGLITRPRLYKLFLLFLTWLCYAQSLRGQFVFDDVEAIVNNQDVRWPPSEWTAKSIFAPFVNDFWGTPIASNRSHKSYRPLTILSFRFNHWCSGLEPWSYHLVNLIIHGIVVLLFNDACFILLRHISATLSGNKNHISAMAAFLFSLHPVHTEPVVNIVGRAELLSAAFFLAAFLMYSSDLDSSKDESWWEVKICGKAVILSGIAMLTKEQGVTVLGFIIVYDAVIVNGDLIGEIWQHGQKVKQDQSNNNVTKPCSPFQNTRLKELCLRVIILSAGAFLMLLGRLAVMDFNAPRFSSAENPAAFLSSAVFRSLNYQYIWLLNLWILVCPIWLCFDWSLGCVPLITTFADCRILLLIFAWTSFAYLGRQCWTRNAQFNRCWLAGLSLLLIPALPASNLVMTVGFVVAERVLYLPSMGYCLLISIAMFTASQRFAHKSFHVYFKTAVITTLLLYGLRSRQRTEDWLSEENLYRSGLVVCPKNAKIHYNLGKILIDYGNRKSGIECYREALRLFPNYDHALNNLGNVLKDEGKLGEAEKWLQRAVNLRYNFPSAWMNLGIVQAARRNAHQAEISYQTSLRLKPTCADCYFNLGNLYIDQNKSFMAMSCWKNATMLDRGHTRAWINMIILADNNGDSEMVYSIAAEALSYLPSDAGLCYTYANALGKAGHFMEAESWYKAAIEIHPGHAGAYTNLGVLYHRWKRYAEAERAYSQALLIDPNISTAATNLQKLKAAHSQQNR